MRLIRRLWCRVVGHTKPHQDVILPSGVRCGAISSNIPLRQLVFEGGELVASFGTRHCARCKAVL